MIAGIWQIFRQFGETYTTVDGNHKCGVDTNIIDCSSYAAVGNGNGIFAIIMIVLNVLTVSVLVVAVLGFILSGVQYISARDNEAQVVSAKKRMMQIITGVIIYAVAWTGLEWIVPGGLINDAIKEKWEYTYVAPTTGTGTGTGAQSVSCTAGTCQLVAGVSGLLSRIASGKVYQAANEAAWSDKCLTFAVAHANMLKTGASCTGARAASGNCKTAYSGQTVMGLNNYLKKVYTQLKAGKAVIIQVTGGGSGGSLAGYNRHYVLAVGYKTGADENNLRASDFYYVDSWDGTMQQLADAPGSGRALCRNAGAGQKCNATADTYWMGTI